MFKHFVLIINWTKSYNYSIQLNKFSKRNYILHNTQKYESMIAKFQTFNKKDCSLIINKFQIILLSLVSIKL